MLGRLSKHEEVIAAYLVDDLRLPGQLVDVAQHPLTVTCQNIADYEKGSA